ncbi:MAG: pyridoxine 5'-phosphate synthase [Candidatus Dadabacteria bacterium]|nr:pyridoxine 5'-phosphate synthase [Candidatus Dadabacteria bacterium]NIS07825.1 pyridoxine 5'-phosphate synthase [Candidatus Dadabacteria bacterium]NIV42779.1 pyridoxine 5'-phosphate synthase [Candidatus Dadabacteria bacterium]NIX14844.1 pyridoxine 5'-phosphate synthase [Candidatus Dadabacteria bacterium]NIY21444.1 pyridoxine 5'-phosphate synthase [Candidatus Dadabacteria bacterium]
MPRLNVNIDHVATLRQARLGSVPDPVFAAYISELAGADGIVVHLREDRRHIQDRDLNILRQTVKTKLNLEMAPAKEMLKIAQQVKPDMVTLVPEKRKELTTEGGLDVINNKKNITAIVTKLKKSGIFTSLFIDPEDKQIEMSKMAGSDMVEIHTGKYADSLNEEQRLFELNKIISSVNHADDLDLRVAAGHGLDYTNTNAIAEIKNIEELNIGYSIICRSIIVGIERAVKEMAEICSN